MFTTKHGVESYQVIATYADEQEAKSAERKRVVELVEEGFTTAGAGASHGYRKR